MILNIDSVYRITFDTGFGDINGIYKVLQIVNHDKLLELEIDLVATLYAAVGKTQIDFDTDTLVYELGLYYQIQSITDSDVSYYVPSGIISIMPEINIAEYLKLILTFDIGVFADADALSTLTTTIQEVLTASHGIVTTPQLLTYDKVWLTDTEYDEAVAIRTAAKTGAVNYYSEAVRLEAIVTQLNTKIAALQNIIVSLQGV